MNVAYRPAAADDADFLYALHKAAMRAYVEEVYGPWDDAWQRAFFAHHFDLSLMRIIQAAGQDVGLLYIQPRAEELFLAEIEIMPAYQGQGIGAAVIREVQAEAARLGKPVALQVLKVNRRARALYQRLGFGVTGETETHYIMAWGKI